MGKRGFFAALLAVLLLITAGCGVPAIQPDDTTAPPSPDYTYRRALAEHPVNWSPMNVTTQTEAELLAYTAGALYQAVTDGADRRLVPEMAAAAPVDVTGDYAGDEAYGVPRDAQSGYAYRIDLNPQACWSDGLAITAADYLRSLETLLDSSRKYPRAADFISGPLQIAGGWEYYMQDQVGTATYRSLADAGFASVSEARRAGYPYFYLDMESFWGLDCGWQPVTSPTLYRDDSVTPGDAEEQVSPQYLYETYLAAGMPYEAYQTTFVGILDKKVEETDFSRVGLLQTGEYQLTLILEVPLSAEALESALTEPWLIREDVDPDSYGTSPETTPCCGPYRLVRVTAEEVYLERNENWYGDYDGLHQGQYQATAISCRYFEDENALREAFEAGELDVAELPEGDVITPLTQVTRLTCNSSPVALKRREGAGISKRILALTSFRKALSLAVDREALAKLWPGSEAAEGLLGSSFRLDQVGGPVYRETEPGIQALNVPAETAGDLLQQAWEEALNRGWVTADSTVELELLVYSDDPVYDRAVSLIQDALSLAAVGTDLENRIRIVKTVNPAYNLVARQGDFDLVFSTWGGVEWDPWGMLKCCCDEELRLEYGFAPNVDTLTLTVQGTAQTRTYRGWYEALVSGIYAGAALETRLEVLAGLERGLLEQYCAIALYQRGEITAVSPRLERGQAPGWAKDLRTLRFLEADS